MERKLAQKVDELDVYKLAFTFQQELFGLSRTWPAEEKYSLTDQIRRSSRSIGANLAEAWAKRRYPAHFVSKLTDADGELQETYHWLATAHACNYFDDESHVNLCRKAGTIGKQLGSMINKHRSFCLG